MFLEEYSICGLNGQIVIEARNLQADGVELEIVGRKR